MLNKQISYLIGLLCGRGHIFVSSKRIIIELAHKNEIAEGIAHCPNCGEVATGNNTNDFLICRNKVNKSVKKKYYQKESTINSLKNTIIPFLKEEIDCSYDYIGNNSITCLILDFSEKEQNTFENIQSIMNNQYSFDSFIIPDEIKLAHIEYKKEFINGLLDSAGFFNAGGWYPRIGKNSNTRMRAYFQIVRNWYMPVQICNFLRSHFSLPIQTIDWGHPNIRDSAMNDYFESNSTSWSREHQIKFLPEYYINEFHLRLEHKQQMFEELASHNRYAQFDTNENCTAPTEIKKKNLKAYHPEENSKRIPAQTRKHCDSFWQVCHNMGCIHTNNLIKQNQLFYELGTNNKQNAGIIVQQFHEQRIFLTDKISAKHNNSEPTKEKNRTKNIRKMPEKELYAPICTYLKQFLTDKYGIPIDVYDTSSSYLDNFISRNGLEGFEFCENYKIKPDIVGLSPSTKELIFVEVKDEEPTIKGIGQLLGYCLVAKPKDAILVSPKPPNLTLLKLLKTNSDFLSYDIGKKIKIAIWENNTFKLI